MCDLGWAGPALLPALGIGTPRDSRWSSKRGENVAEGCHLGAWAAARLESGSSLRPGLCSGPCKLQLLLSVHPALASVISLGSMSSSLPSEPRRALVQQRVQGGLGTARQGHWGPTEEMSVLQTLAQSASVLRGSSIFLSTTHHRLPPR